MTINLTALQKQRRDTAANWTGANPTLLAGEIGIESDTNKIKIGDGSTAWTSLSYTTWSQISAYPIVNADVAAAAAISYSKLATLTSANIVLGSSANVATSTAVTGDVTISNTGVTAIASGVIVNADINASAAIADTKLGTISTALKVSNSATTATDANTASAIVARDASGNFTAGTITANLTGTASNVTTNANLTGDVTSVGNATTIAAGVIVDADINASAAIVDTKLATIATAGKVSNSATTATSANTASAIVARDASGNFTAGTITATLTGNASTVTTNANLTGDVTSIGNATTIAAGVIVDADVNASAAIAGTKVAPDFGSQTVITTGSALIGTATSLSTLYSGAGKLQVASNDATTIQSYAFSSTGVDYSATLELSRARNTQASPTIVANGDYIGQINFAGYNTNFQRGATIYALVDGEPGTAGDTTDMPGKLVFATTPNGSATPTTAMTIDSSQRVGIGTSSPGYLLDVNGQARFSGNPIINGSSLDINPASGTPNIAFRSGNTYRGYLEGNSSGGFSIGTGSAATIAMTIDSSQRVGIGTQSPNALLDVRSATAWVGDGTTDAFLQFNQSATAANRWHIGAGSGNAFIFYKGTYGTGVETARIDTSGRLLVGTSTARDKFFGSLATSLQVEGSTTPLCSLSITRSDAGGDSSKLVLAHARGTSNQILIADDAIGDISWQGADGNKFIQAANIRAFVDGTPGVDDMPGRLVFSTTADGASSPTERMRIKANGSVYFNTLTGTESEANSWFIVNGASNNVGFSAYGYQAVAGNINRSDDGDLLNFRSAGVTEGTISVSGTTVSYNGAHLSRWSQLFSGAERTEILRGSVLSNLDEMCEWGDEENEQLNRMKVSDVEGDKNVSGVFQAWDDDDDTYTNDFYCAMTGDFIIRIAEGVTVERGDLLMSAGDGTAKPQDDDIIRSKTIAKVTSTTVSCTYEDGSYCVPCVLMAC